MSHYRRLASATTALAAAGLLVPRASHAAPLFAPGDLIVSYSVYAGDASTIAVGQALPNSNGAVAVANGSYPGVFGNAAADANFGILSPILLQDVRTPNQITASSTPTLNVTAATGIATSFPSKSELAINVSPAGQTLSLGGYNAPINSLDRSNANTPGVVDPTNTDLAPATSRSVVAINTASGATTVTNTSDYSGNNIRAAISTNGVIYTAGNSGNGAKATDSVTTPGSVGAQLLATTGVQVVTPGTGASVPAGQFTAADGDTLKDNNFRGLTISDNTLYTSKGSGSNGINTVYQVGTAGTLPTGGASTSISVLPGFPTLAASAQTCTIANCSSYYAPFGLFFANATTLYVADEGNAGTINDPHAGLEKWTLVNGTWMLAYTLQSGLNLYTPYAVAGYPANLDPYATGLRNLAGQVNADGTVTLYASTSTNSASGDAGADPNQIVAINDLLGATSLPTGESFSVVEGGQYGVVYRGVAIAPVPEPATLGLLGTGLAGLLLRRRRKR